MYNKSGVVTCVDVNKSEQSQALQSSIDQEIKQNYFEDKSIYPVKSINSIQLKVVDELEKKNQLRYSAKKLFLVKKPILKNDERKQPQG